FRSAKFSTDASGVSALFVDFDRTLIESMAGPALFGLAVIGIAFTIRERGVARDRRWSQFAPLLASASYYLFFVQIIRQAEDRFTLLPSVLLTYYAGVAIAAIAARVHGPVRTACAAALACAIGYAAYETATLDIDLQLDPRYDAERFLAARVPDGAS